MDILSIVISFQCSCIKRLYVNSSHPCKILHSYVIDTHLGKKFKFRSNLGILANKIKRFPIYDKQIFTFINLPSAFASQVIWYNKYTKAEYVISYITLKYHEKILITLDSFSDAKVNLNYGKN